MAFGFGLGVQRLGSFGVALLADLTALAPAADLRPTGFVYADASAANNGVYTWSGAAWVRQRGLPDGFGSFGGVAGTADAITGTIASGVDPAQIKAAVLIPAANNTGAATLNGEAIVDRSGNPLVAGALVAGVAALLFRDGASWRLMTGNVAEIADISGLQAALDGKAAVGHAHAIADVTGLQAEIDAKAPINSPTFTGAPAAPTAAPGTNTTQIATTGFVQAAIDVVKGGVSAAFDTLAELAAGLATKLTAANNLSDVPDAATARSNLGLEIGAQVQGFHARLASLAGLAFAAGDLIYATGANALARLPKGADGKLLGLSGGFPAWVDAPSSGGMTLLGTINTTSGSSQTLNSLSLSGYAQIFYSINNVKKSSEIATMSLGGVQVFLCDTTAGDGMGWVDLSTGLLFGLDPLLINFIRQGNTTISAVSTSITFTLSSGSFSGGSIKIYGVK